MGLCRHSSRRSSEADLSVVEGVGGLLIRLCDDDAVGDPGCASDPAWPGSRHDQPHAAWIERSTAGLDPAWFGQGVKVAPRRLAVPMQ